MNFDKLLSGINFETNTVTTDDSILLEETKYKVIPLKVSIYNEDDHPIFGEKVIHLEVDDESAGTFFILTQEDDGTLNTIKADMSELELIVKEARKLYNLHEGK